MHASEREELTFLREEVQRLQAQVNNFSLHLPICHRSHTSRCRPTFVRIISGPPSRRSSRRLRRELIHFQLILNGPYYLFITDTTTLSKSLNTYFVFSPHDRCDRLHGQGRGRLVSADEGYVVDNGSSL